MQPIFVRQITWFPIIQIYFIISFIYHFIKLPQWFKSFEVEIIHVFFRFSFTFSINKVVKLNEWHTCFLCIAFFRKHTFLLVRNKNTTTWYSCFIYGVESAVYHPFFFVIKVRLTFKSRTNRNWSIYSVYTPSQ